MSNEPLRRDLHKLQKVSGPTGSPRFVAESDSGGHADRAWACFLAVSAAVAPHMEYGYAPARPEADKLYRSPHRMRMRPDFDDEDFPPRSALGFKPGAW